MCARRICQPAEKIQQPQRLCVCQFLLKFYDNLQVYVRQKNLSARRKTDSCVPQAKAAVIEGPLTQEEKAKVCAFCVQLRWRWCMSGTAVYALPGRL